MKKRVSLLLFLILTLLLFTSCGKNAENKEKTFTTEDFSIVLNESFTEEKTEGTDTVAAFLSTDYGINFIKATFEEIDALGYDAGSLSDYDYMKLVMSANDISGDPIKNGRYYTFTIEEKSEEETLSYLGAVLKGDDAFCLVQIYCEKSLFETSNDLFLKWLDSIKIL